MIHDSSVICESKKMSLEEYGKEIDVERMAGNVKAFINKEEKASVITGLSVSIKTRVPNMVSTPEKSWVKPISSPSAKVSTSVMIRETRSPAGCESR